MSDPATAPEIRVYTTKPALSEAAIQLALRLGLELASTDVHADILLVLNHADLPWRLELLATGQHSPGPVYVDFVHGAAGYRRRQNEGLRQPLAKAIGIKGNDRPSLLDATPGLGRDAFVLACLGCRVTMIERSPIVHALLENGLQRALRNEEVKSIIAQHLHLIAGDACDTLARCKEEERPDVVYLDPMYPHRTKSALVKKEMRMLRGIVGDDEDAPSLLHLALEHARKRVAVKRPRLAPPLEAEISPSMSIEGKNTRYDVYITSHS